MHKHQGKRLVSTGDYIMRTFLTVECLKSIQPVLALTATCTRWVTLLSCATCWCCWSCRVISIITVSLTLSRRTIPQPVTRLTPPKTSLSSYKTLGWMVLTTVRASEVSLGPWNNSLRFRAWCSTFWSYLFLEDGTLVDEVNGAENFCWFCEWFPPPDFF